MTYMPLIPPSPGAQVTHMNSYASGKVCKSTWTVFCLVGGTIPGCTLPAGADWLVVDFRATRPGLVGPQYVGRVVHVCFDQVAGGGISVTVVDSQAKVLQADTETQTFKNISKTSHLYNILYTNKALYRSL